MSLAFIPITSSQKVLFNIKALTKLFDESVTEASKSIFLLREKREELVKEVLLSVFEKKYLITQENKVISKKRIKKKKSCVTVSDDYFLTHSEANKKSIEELRKYVLQHFDFFVMNGFEGLLREEINALQREYLIEVVTSY